MARALLIMNPAAARTTPAAIQTAEAVLRHRGWHTEVMATGGSGDARRLAEYGIDQGVDVVAVFGGDGTTMQAASALVGSEVALALIPGGTGNILAGNLRLPKSPARAAEIIAEGYSRRLDLGQVERPDGLLYFAVAAGAGMDARIMTETEAARKRRWGIGAYWGTLVRVLPEIRSVECVITVDGEPFAAEAAVVLVSNCGEVIPPFFRLRSDTSPEDGLLDVTVARANSIWEGVRVLREAIRPRAETRARPDLLGFARGKEIRVEPVEPMPVQLDGDGCGETPFTARVVPGAIRIMLGKR
ncbi:MAG: diacylglycerol kinase family lipid kinase [Gemmatimonadales bacterium]|nr:diacylglycerol kinase family lipid kinase [Gemmatimonadales bacterium]